MLPVASEIMYVDIEALPASCGVLYGVKINKTSVETRSALRNLASATKRFVGLSCNSASQKGFNPLNAELNPICHLLALLGAHHILHVSRIRVKQA